MKKLNAQQASTTRIRARKIAWPAQLVSIVLKAKVNLRPARKDIIAKVTRVQKMVSLVLRENIRTKQTTGSVLSACLAMLAKLVA